MTDLDWEKFNNWSDAANNASWASTVENQVYNYSGKLK